ncbi:DNA-directed RNA polymerase subunit beta' [Mycoplasma sp. (ex Biomphalaria glabrata)]|uniref:DNA-directed RNA polymerase subunit beta' n=1 Tax=Mycoplasma sp. (ex Biomphalaria glabrata) TaxID=1749074 RepID=UPI00073AD576|nr:DNA-directed RNA polymerase subunit beta' [Mycoplasma sp. (ex Biomphalaria glabrata)]ALV23611.1 DNA-directed RNA polymerase subunit beta' [Mycoplasma sp. (ex Biomphalaria glabrata)]
MKTHKDINYISLGLASPEKIIEWSHGEVTKSETINYKTQKPEPDGLFCEKIFGPVKDYECACGKYKKVRNKGKVCERCEVEVTESIVRRERFGHINLAAPVTHIWMLKTSPSKLGQVLALKTKDIEEVVYFISYIVINEGGHEGKPKSGLKHKDILDQNQGREKLINSLRTILKQGNISDNDIDLINVYLGDLANRELPYNFEEIIKLIERITGAKFGVGAEAIRELLENIDITIEIKNLRNQISKNIGDISKNTKRLGVLEAFHDSQNKLEWMILTTLPVLPPNLRPIIQLDGGRFTSSDINDLYRRIIIRNERLQKLIDVEAPKIVINNEKRMLQEAVDALLDNERKQKPFVSKDKRPLKSLSEILKGKQGRFRQNLLGKRVDYSGRSVIIVGPELKMHECGLPREIALNLYKPFIISELIRKNQDTKMNIKSAERRIQDKTDEVWEILEEVVKSRPVLLNRAPTLHRLGIQAFEPVIIKSKAIRLHPLVTPAFNADFDGDQMAVHLPLSDEAIAEARALLIGSKNILGLKDGKPIVTPTQDIVLGIYNLCREQLQKDEDINIFYQKDDVISAYEQNHISLHDIILLSTRAYPNKPFTTSQKDGFIITTAGKVIFNDALPATMRFINSGNIRPSAQYIRSEHIVVFGKNSSTDFVGLKDISELYNYLANEREAKIFNKKSLSLLIVNLFKDFKGETAYVLDQIKNLGFKFSTKAGVTISAFDLLFKDKNDDDIIFEYKKNVLQDSANKIKQYKSMYSDGLLTEEERKIQVTTEWTVAKNKVQDKIEEIISSDKYRNNPIFQMIDSGARGNISNMTQLVGMRGLMSNPKGETIELPIKSSFREGLDVSEFFISTHGARKGMADTALKTADSGYLTRRLVDVSQEIIVSVEDCFTSKSFVVSNIVDTKTNSFIVPLKDRLVGRFIAENITIKGKKIIEANQLITDEIADEIVEANVERVQIRSLLTCEAEAGVCQKCYGTHLANNELVKIGEAVGVIAAQSIGEPGTQLTMRTFHTGGVAGGSDITQGLPRIKELFDVTQPKGRVALISRVEGKVTKITDFNHGQYEITIEYERHDSDGKKVKDYEVYKSKINSKLRVKMHDVVRIGQKLTDGSIDLRELLEVADVTEVQKYILKEVQRVYRLQGIEISDKYIEIIVRQTLNKLVVIIPGDSKLLIGSHIDVNKFKKINKELLMNKKRPIFAKPIILGIKKAPLESESFLSAASFQDTTRVLANVVIEGKSDHLVGLKENVIIGNLIPAGTGLLTSEEIIELGNKAKSEQY